MNILDEGMWPGDPAPARSAEAWLDLLDRRRATFLAFCDLEREKGFIAPPVSLALPKGQDTARLLMFRAIEEFTEAVNSTSEEHRLEELIDSVCYVMSVLLIDPETFTDVDVLRFADELGTADNIFGLETHLSMGDLSTLGQFTYYLATATELFRNRAWMVNVQDMYFAGKQALFDALLIAVKLIQHHFDSWESFWGYYVAKDNVLQFRLRTRY